MLKGQWSEGDTQRHGPCARRSFQISIQFSFKFRRPNRPRKTNAAIIPRNGSLLL